MVIHCQRLIITETASKENQKTALSMAKDSQFWTSLAFTVVLTDILQEYFNIDTSILMQNAKFQPKIETL